MESTQNHYPLKKSEVKNLLNFAINLSLGAGKILLEEQKSAVIAISKEKNDFATTADLKSEEFIIGNILKKYPDHGILSEEKGELNKSSVFQWIIDPLDGTKEYFRNIPLWNCSLMLKMNNQTILAVVNRPLEKTMFYASKGFYSYRNNIKISVSSVKNINDSFVYCYLPNFKKNKTSYENTINKLSRLGKHVFRLRSSSDENSALCWLAQGGCEAYLNLSNAPKIHDIEPGLFIAKKSGAFIDLKTYPVIACNNKNIYNQIIKIIS